MGLLDNLFGKDKKENTSYVRAWAEGKAKELKYSNDLNLESLFAGITYGLTRFGLTKFAYGKKQIKKDNYVSDIIKHYSGDSTLFEVGCYLYFRIDMWLFSKLPKYREEVSYSFVRQFNQLFTEALQISNLPELFNERVSKYGELARNNDSLENFHFYLSELILLTKDNTPPKTYNFDNAPLTLSFWDGFVLKIEILSFEQHMIPAIIKSIENYYARDNKGRAI